MLVAVVLAGGAARRLGGIDKPALTIAGVTLLDGVLAVLAGASRVVVVGPARPTTKPVIWTRESPIRSGPLAALAAGVRALGDQLDDRTQVAALAADLVGMRSDTVGRLAARLARHPDADGAVLVDDSGRVQWLCGVWWLGALRRALPTRPAGRSLHSVLSPLDVVHVESHGAESADVDTAADLDWARRRHEPPE